MATYQIISIEDFKKKGARHITPRMKPDLPEEIIGSGVFWKDLGKSPKNYDIPPTYHIVYKGEDTLIEFFNNKWCYLQWDDDKFLGYWVFPSQTIEQGKHNLGWLGNTIGTQTPTSLIQFRECTESGSTHSEQYEDSQEEELEGEDPMDMNPEQTERLAQTFMENPVFQDIAEAVDEPQDLTSSPSVPRHLQQHQAEDRLKYVFCQYVSPLVAHEGGPCDCFGAGWRQGR